MKISAVHAEHTEDSAGYAFDFDGIKVYISGDTKSNEKLKEVASCYPDIVLIYANGKPKEDFIEQSSMSFRRG